MFSNNNFKDAELCIALAFSLQYVRLCVLCWMLTMAHHMHSQFRTSLHLNPITDNAIGKHFFRYSVFGWGVPGVLLGASVMVQYHDKAGKLLDTASLKSQNCWFLDRNAFIYGLLVPSAIFITVTFYYLVRSALVARYVISMQVDRKIRDKMRRKRMLHIALFAKVGTVKMAQRLLLRKL
ncbi:hypothetical protein MTP99_011220 [Tenebrio molitor]|nr:hypothetical protein MTP99_011220 [Tenebrio molitor]